MNILKLLIIGSGNVAIHLAKAFSQIKNCEVMIAARDVAKLEKITFDFDIKTFPIDKIPFADVYIIATSDSSIAEVSKIIHYPLSIVAHTSGSMSIDEIKLPNPKAVFYPLQSFSLQKELNYKEIPIFIESENEEVFNLLKNIAEKTFGKTEKMDFEQRKALHLSAVFACNFVNHMFCISNEIALDHKFSFDLLMPLITETFDKIKNISPKDAQTGPAIRQDKRVIDLHEDLIKNNFFLKVYQSINQSIINYYYK